MVRVSRGPCRRVIESLSTALPSPATPRADAEAPLRLNAVLKTPRRPGAAAPQAAAQAASPAAASTKKRSAVKSASKWKSSSAKEAPAEGQEAATEQPLSSRDAETKVRSLDGNERQPRLQKLIPVVPLSGTRHAPYGQARRRGVASAGTDRSILLDLPNSARFRRHSRLKTSPPPTQAAKETPARDETAEAGRGQAKETEEAQPGPGSAGQGEGTGKPGKETAAQRLARWKAAGATENAKVSCLLVCGCQDVTSALVSAVVIELANGPLRAGKAPCRRRRRR